MLLLFETNDSLHLLTRLNLIELAWLVDGVDGWVRRLAGWWLCSWAQPGRQDEIGQSLPPSIKFRNRGLLKETIH